jgi:hypothetical protein
MDWLGDLIRDLVREWPTVMAAPLPFLAAVAASLIFGWSAAWLILRQRLIHHKELVESYKEREAAPKKGSGRTRNSQIPPQLIFSTKQMLLGIAIIIAIVAIPSILILSEAKPPNTIMSRIKIGDLSMFHAPDELDYTRFNVGFINFGALAANNLHARLSGQLTKDVLDNSITNGRMDKLKDELKGEEKVKSSIIIDVGDASIVTIDDVKASKDEIVEFETGKLLLYVFAAIDWTDSSLASSQHWHLDFCGFFQSNFSLYHHCTPSNAVVRGGPPRVSVKLVVAEK